MRSSNREGYGMTTSERAKMRKLELENYELRARVAKDAEVWRDQALELIDLRARLALLAEIIEEHRAQ